MTPLPKPLIPRTTQAGWHNRHRAVTAQQKTNWPIGLKLTRTTRGVFLRVKRTTTTGGGGGTTVARWA